MNYGSAIKQKANVPLRAKQNPAPLHRGSWSWATITILCKSSNMEVKTRSGNCLWFSGLFGWSMYPSLSYLPFLVFSFVRILLFILMPTFYTGILTRPFFSLWVSLGLFLLSWHNAPKALPYSCSIIQSCCNPWQWRGTNVLWVVGCEHLSMFIWYCCLHMSGWLWLIYYSKKKLFFFLILFRCSTEVWVLCAKNRQSVKS